jgi:hypothetical protein
LAKAAPPTGVGALLSSVGYDEVALVDRVPAPGAQARPTSEHSESLGRKSAIAARRFLTP